MTEQTKWILKILITLPMILATIGFLVYTEINLDKDLTDFDRRKVIYENFEKEFKEMETPPKTADNRFEKLGTLRKPIVAYKIYRSELPKKEVFEHFDAELQKNDWINVDRSNSEKIIIYCKGKFQATLEPSFDKFGDNAIYLSVSFSLGLSNKCKE